MTSTEVAWAIGIFEGEGSIVFNSRGHGVTLSIQMVDKDIIERFYQIVGVGKINGPYQNGKGHQVTWCWRLHPNQSVKELLETWLPYFGNRRQARTLIALDRLKLFNKYPVREKCRLRGHKWTPQNTYIAPGTGWRMCRACRKLK